jgi:hypothetical protein
LVIAYILMLKKNHVEYSHVSKRLDLPPHIFWIASTAYNRMLADKTTQCIAVSGESGAGKTESTKYMIQHIIHLCKNDVDKELQNKIIEVFKLAKLLSCSTNISREKLSKFSHYRRWEFLCSLSIA